MIIPETSNFTNQKPNGIVKVPGPEETRPGERICHEYFMLYSHHSDGKAVGERLAVYTAYVISSQEFFVPLLFLKDKFEVRIDQAKKRPTAKLIVEDGSVVVGVVLRMNKADYQEAKDCLPKVGKTKTN